MSLRSKNSTAAIAAFSLLAVLLIILRPTSGEDLFDFFNKPYSSPYLAASRSPTIDNKVLEPLTTVNNNSLFARAIPPETIPRVLWSVWVPVTAYSSTYDQTDSSPFITASGSWVRDGIVAANFLPIGTKVRLPTIYGDKIFVVEDRMNARYWQRLDIWMPTTAQARQFGLRTLPIEIIRTI